MKIKKNLFPKVTKKQAIEFGLVAILVTSVFAFWLNDKNLVLAIIILSLVTIITPILLYPFAALWFGLSQVLSHISSTIVLSLVFFIIVTPVGLIRKLMGKDSLKIKQFKKNNQSVLIDRNHLYAADDLTHTF